ncbi:tripartite tricarboxylate transporter TctB family protein [Fusibacter sp. 3D3]|uniref:tripartite tricarboxylate transporter TctB family protein n=1 Tax=Fusibacter sp. 3D3 TaxID=1048380 RepID=UPI0008534282|nr:tripartite tricarboxylate transporter TctB family protein [Fusibacter sp. 3D3]
MKKNDFAMGIIGLILSSYVFFTARLFPESPSTLVGPSYFPIILSLGLFALCIILIIQSLVSKTEDKTESIDLKSPGIMRSFASFLATIVYVSLLQILGFMISSVLYLFFLMLLLKNKEYVKMSIISVVVSVAVYFIFKSVLHITLPTGIFF